jgi:uncharacterized membrane protein YkvA (DUF1232 family)
MTLRITFDLEDKDLKYFRAQMKRAQASGERATEAEVIAKAQLMIEEVANTKVPAFVAQRLEKLGSLIAMLEDDEWALEARERRNVVGALAYFADPEDLIPDNVPVIGYIDDAIMIELVVKELGPEIEAFDDFCRYRREEASRNRNPDISREQWLAAKRRDLHARMKRRRRSRSSRTAGRTRVRLF